MVWFSVVVDGLDRGLTGGGRGGSWVAGWTDLWRNKPGLGHADSSQVRRLLRRAIGCLPGTQVATSPHAFDGDMVKLAIEILMPFVSHAPVLQLAEYDLEGIAMSCMSVIKSGEDHRELDDDAYALLEAIIRRGPVLEEAGNVKKSVLGGMASKVGAVVAKGGQFASLAQRRCLGACLMMYPQAFKSKVDDLWEIARKGQYGLDIFVMLPRVSGSAEVWSACGEVVMESLDVGLGILLDGMERESGSNAAATTSRLLGIPGGDGDAISSMKMASFPELIGHLHALFSALQTLITSAFPIPVPMPITRIVALAQRLLQLDITRIELIQRVGRTAGQVCSLGVGISSLQIDALKIMKAVLTACGGHVVPYMGEVNRVLNNALEAALTLKVYGNEEGHAIDVPMVCGLYAAVRKSLQIDGVAGGRVFEEVLVELVRLEIYGRSSSEVDTLFPQSWTQSNTLAISMLGLLETLFHQAISAIRPASRLYLEDVVLHVAKTAYQLVEKKMLATNRDCVKEKELLEAALGALEASVLAPSAYRPTHAAEALRLFRRIRPGQSQRAAQAVRCLEASIHPKSLDMRVKMDNTELTARHELGVPVFWLASMTSDVVQVVVKAATDDGDQVVADAAEKDEIIRATEPTKKPTKVPTVMADNKKRTATLARERSTHIDDTSKRFKISSMPVEDSGTKAEQKDEKKLEAANLQDLGKRRGQVTSSDEDDFLDMIDSGGEEDD